MNSQEDKQSRLLEQLEMVTVAYNNTLRKMRLTSHLSWYKSRKLHLSELKTGFLDENNNFVSSEDKDQGTHYFFRLISINIRFSQRDTHVKNIVIPIDLFCASSPRDVASIVRNNYSFQAKGKKKKDFVVKNQALSICMTTVIGTAEGK